MALILGIESSCDETAVAVIDGAGDAASSLVLFHHRKRFTRTMEAPSINIL